MSRDFIAVGGSSIATQDGIISARGLLHLFELDFANLKLRMFQKQAIETVVSDINFHSGFLILSLGSVIQVLRLGAKNTLKMIFTYPMDSVMITNSAVRSNGILFSDARRGIFMTTFKTPPNAPVTRLNLRAESTAFAPVAVQYFRFSKMQAVQYLVADQDRNLRIQSFYINNSKML